MATPPETPNSGKSASSEALLRCSFCGKSQEEVRKLIAGPKVYICDECIDLCNEILEREVDSEPEHAPARAFPSSPVAACPLCRLPKAAVELQMIEERGVLCVECLDAVRSVLDATAASSNAT